MCVYHHFFFMLGFVLYVFWLINVFHSFSYLVNHARNTFFSVTVFIWFVNLTISSNFWPAIVSGFFVKYVSQLLCMWTRQYWCGMLWNRSLTEATMAPCLSLVTESTMYPNAVSLLKLCTYVWYVSFSANSQYMIFVLSLNTIVQPNLPKYFASIFKFMCRGWSNFLCLGDLSKNSWK